MIAPAPEVNEERETEIQGNPAELTTGSQRDRELTLLSWEMDDLAFIIAGFNIEVETIKEIAESIQPIV